MYEERLTSMKIRLWSIFFLVILFGCTSVPDNSAINSTPTNIPSITIQALASVQPVSTAVLEESLIQLHGNRECVEVVSDTDEVYEGVLVFQKERGDRLVFIEGQTGNPKIVPESNGKVWGAYVSLNRRWLMYEVDPDDNSEEHWFVLTNSDGVKQIELLFGDWSVSSIFWLNDNALRVAEPDNAVTSINNYALDPLTGTKTALPSDFPKYAGRGVDWQIDRNAIELGITKGINLIYDPTLTKVIYPYVDGAAVIFDLESNQEIARLSAPGRGRLPKWSPDGKQVAVIGTGSNTSKGENLDSFLIASHDGSRVQRLLVPSSSAENIHIEDYSWSPDGSRIALWLRSDNSEVTSAQNPFELAVIDLVKNELTGYCISGTSTIEHELYTDQASIIWSPNGEQLLIVQYNNESNNNTDQIIIDLASKSAHKVAENLQPIGWMITTP